MEDESVLSSTIDFQNKSQGVSRLKLKAGGPSVIEAERRLACRQAGRRADRRGLPGRRLAQRPDWPLRVPVHHDTMAELFI